MNYEQQKALKQFNEEFSKKVNDTVVSLEMIYLEAETETYAELNLVSTSVSKELWGLLVFCENGLYFYVHPYESVMGMMFREAVRGKAPVEQLLTIHTLDSVKFTLQKRRWYDYIIGSAADKIIMQYKNSAGEQRMVLVSSQNKASKVIEKIEAFFTAHPQQK